MPTDSHPWALGGRGRMCVDGVRGWALSLSVMANKKNSLVNNINKRKAAGKSRPKAKSTVSDKAYAAMKKGWK